MSRAFADEIELNNYIEKIRCFKNMQEDNKDLIERQLNNVLQYYKTSNSSKYSSKCDKTILELKELDLNLNKYIYVLEKAIIRYQLLAKNTTGKFENIISGVDYNE